MGFAAASALVAAAVALTHRGTPPPGSDQAGYLDLARQWRAGDGLSSSAEVSAGYPLFVAAVDLARRLTWLSLDLGAALALAQALVHGATVVATGVLGCRVVRPAVGLGAAAMVAVWPNLVLAPAVALSEPLATLLVVLVVLLLFGWPQATTGRLVAAAAALGLTVEVRPGTLVLLVLFLAVPETHGAPARARTFLLGTVVLLAFVAPFAVRSSYAARAFVPLDLRAGVSLCLGRLPEADGGPIAYDRCPAPPGAGAVEADAAHRARAWALLRAHPGREPALVLGRLRATVWDDDRSSSDELDRRDGRDLDPRLGDLLSGWSTGLSRVVVVLAAVATAGAAWRRASRVAWTIGAGWLLLVPALVALGDPRFRMPAAPLLAIGATTTVYGLVARARTPRTPFSSRGAGR